MQCVGLESPIKKVLIIFFCFYFEFNCWNWKLSQFNSSWLVILNFNYYIHFHDFIPGRYVLKKIRLAKQTEKFKRTAHQEVGVTNPFTWCIYSVSIIQFYFLFTCFNLFSTFLFWSLTMVANISFLIDWTSNSFHYCLISSLYLFFWFLIGYIR